MESLTVHLAQACRAARIPQQKRDPAPGVDLPNRRRELLAVLVGHEPHRVADHVNLFPKEQRGAFIELTWGGTEPVVVGDQKRSFLEDGDEVTRW